jgi:hypothetical protein
MDMNYVDTISTFVITNKWSIIFILFAIFAAYSLGVQYASTRKAESFAEGFKTSCGTDVGIPLEPEIPVITPKPIVTEKPKMPETPEKNRQRKIVIINGTKSKKEPVKVEAKDSDDDDDNDEEKSNNCPNMHDYVLKDAVRKNFISKRNVDANYIKKEDCLAQIEKDKKALEEIRSALEQKREAHMERERQKLENQKQILIEQREKLRILKEKYEKQENKEVCDKKISNIKKNVSKHQQEDETDDDDASVNDSDAEDAVSQQRHWKKNIHMQQHQHQQRKQPQPQQHQQHHQRNPAPVMNMNDCDANDKVKPKDMYNPYTTSHSHKQFPDMLKQQDMFDKNRTAMDDNYNYLNDAYSTCNLGNCTVNGFPGGLKPRQ